MERIEPSVEKRREDVAHSVVSEFHNQGDAKWIVIRGQLRGHNDTPFGRPAPGWPIGRLGSGRPQGVISVLVTINNVNF
jgi:hypothetical protein